MRRLDLVPDCGSCAAICCVATSFEASDDFAFDKPASTACPHLTPSCRCNIHDELGERGFGGCAAYGCYGAGQRVTRAFGAEAPDRDWGDRGDTPRRDRAFLVMRELHELLWLLTEAAKLCPPSRDDLRAHLASEANTLDVLASASLPSILDIDIASLRRRAERALRLVGDALGGVRGISELY
jgi:hypothetical protein